MTTRTTLTRLTIAALLAATAALTLAPAADASPRWRRWKESRGGGWGAPPVTRVVYREHSHSGAGPMFAGLVGGILIGSAIANSHPVVVHQHECAAPAPVYSHYRYEDAYGDRWWDTLDECADAARDYHGPRVIRVVDARNDECVRTLYWKHDHWVSDNDDDWDE